MAMPFSPCTDAAKCDDKSVQILTHVFGDVIQRLVGEESLEGVAASSNIIASMFSSFNSGVLIVGAIIITYITIIGMVNTANDGEALGMKWSSMWTPIRIIYGAGSLLPTSSGYSFIQLFIFVIALWGVGLANTVYKAGMTTSVFSPNAIVADVNKTGEFYGLRQFALNYALSQQCIRLIDAAYIGTSGSKPDIAVVNTPDSVTNNGEGLKESTYIFKDRNPKSNLGGGSPVCGSYKLITYVSPHGTDGVGNEINSIDVTVTIAKMEQITKLMNDINGWVSGWPTNSLDADWSKINPQEFITIVNRHEDEIAANLQNQANNNADVKRAIDNFSDSLTSQGWMMAGGWFQRVGATRKRLTQSFGREVAVAAPPTATSVSVTHETKEVGDILAAIHKGLLKAVEKREAENATTPPPRFNEMDNYFPKEGGGISSTVYNLQEVPRLMNGAVNAAMQKVVSAFVGAGDGPSRNTVFCGSNGEMGGSLNRIKCVGDYMASLDTAISFLIYQLQIGVGAFTAALGILDATPIVTSGTDTAAINISIIKMADYFFDVMNSLLMYLRLMAFYFSVFLPSLPYIAFMVVGVGWLLALLQTLLVAPLWMLMHMRPDNTFVGQDNKGYLMLMSLFVRPALAIIGLFLACMLADPVIDYVALAFFEMRGALVTGSGVAGLLPNFNTYIWWIAAFGLTLLPILYMIFFLPQTLADEILRWLGSGLNSLGDSTAVGAVQAGLGSQYGQKVGGGVAPGKLGGRGASGASPAKPQKPDRGGDGGANKTMTNAQGVEPSGGGGSGKGAGSRTVPPLGGKTAAKIGEALGSRVAAKQSKAQTPPTGSITPSPHQNPKIK